MSSTVGERRRIVGVAGGGGTGAALRGNVETNVLRKRDLSDNKGVEFGAMNWVIRIRRQGRVVVRARLRKPSVAVIMVMVVPVD